MKKDSKLNQIASAIKRKDVEKLLLIALFFGSISYVSVGIFILEYPTDSEGFRHLYSVTNGFKLIFIGCVGFYGCFRWGKVMSERKWYERIRRN